MLLAQENPEKIVGEIDRMRTLEPYGACDLSHRLESIWTHVRGLEIHARIRERSQPDDAFPLVLVHGAAVSSLHMAPTAEALAPHFSVYVPDLPGHGRSGTPARVLDARGLADFLAEWMRALGLRRAHVLGNSFGCQIIAELAVRHPEVIERAVLQGPTVDPYAHGFLRQLGRWILNFWREGATQPRVTFKQWAQAGPRVFAMTIRYMGKERIEERLPHINAPVLVVRGSRDPIISPRWAEEASSLLPNGRLAVIDGQTHTITVAGPEALAKVVVPYLREA